MKNLKAIRFNLQFHVGNEIVPARSLSDLNNCMNVDDLYEYFQSGQLERWLKVNGETEKASKVAELQKDDDITTVLSSLFKILGLDFSEEEVSEAIASFVYPKEMQKKKLELKSSLNNIHAEISKDFSAYNDLLKELIESAENFVVVKSKVRELLELYHEQFKLDYIRFYNVMADKCPLAIFAVLMDEKWRSYFLPTDESVVQTFYGELTNQFSELPDNSFCKLMKNVTEDFLKISKTSGNLTFKINGRDMSDSYLIEKGIVKEADYEKSAGSYYDPYPKGSKIMILHCGTGVSVRSYGARGQEMNGAGARFEILDGLEFRAEGNGSTTTNSLFFMEV